MPGSHESFISFLANRHPADGLTKAQIIRMADRLTHGGTWDGEKVVLEERTPLEMAQERILALEGELDKAKKITTDVVRLGDAMLSDERKRTDRFQSKLDAVTALLTEYGVLPLAQRSDLAPPVALNYEQACRIAEMLK